MFDSFSNIILCFIIYSFIGWVCETLYCSIPSGKFVKRGFLRGPCCPIYGVGAYLVILIGEPVSAFPVLVFLFSVIAATLLEYLTGWLLEKAFQIRWWDYTDKKFQLNGRIRLKNSLIFGVLGLMLTYLVHPAVTELIRGIPENYLQIFTNIIFSLLLIDLVSTISRLTGFTERLKQLQADLQGLREDFQILRDSNQKFDWFDIRDLEGSLNRLKELPFDEQEKGLWIERLEKALEKQKAWIPQMGVYKNARSKTLSEAWDSVQDGFLKRNKTRQAPLTSTLKSFSKKTTSALGTSSKTIWKNINVYQLVWTFLLAGVLGYLVETLYCLFTTGAIESRQGLLYGPFSQIYGFGAVILIIFLKPLAQKSDRWAFVGSAIIGGAFEAVCSLIQETAFGSVSWQYGEHHIALFSGRTSLIYMLFWGILGLCFMKGFYPKLIGLIERIPRRKGVILSGVLCVVIACNMVLSAAAVMRWSDRISGSEAEGSVEQYLDERYPDEFMEKVYPNMIWPNN